MQTRGKGQFTLHVHDTRGPGRSGIHQADGKVENLAVEQRTRPIEIFNGDVIEVGASVSPSTAPLRSRREMTRANNGIPSNRLGRN